MKINDTIGDLEDLSAVWSLPKSKIVLKPEASWHKCEALWIVELEGFCEAAVEYKNASVQTPWCPLIQTGHFQLKGKVRNRVESGLINGDKWLPF